MRATQKRKRRTPAGALPRPNGTLRETPAGSSALPDSFLEATIEFWQPSAHRNLTREDAREIVENMTGFFSVLRQWREAERVAARTNGGMSARIDRSAIASSKRSAGAPAKLALP
jgi:hypothetical protein